MRMNCGFKDELQELEQLAIQLMWQLRLDQQRAFEPLGVSQMQAFALLSISQGFEQPGSLATVMETSPPGVSQLLSGLEERGWVRRELDPENKRKVRVLLTNEGKDFLRQMHQRWREVSRERYSRLDSEEINMLIQSYRKLVEPQVVDS